MDRVDNPVYHFRRSNHSLDSIPHTHIRPGNSESSIPTPTRKQENPNSGDAGDSIKRRQQLTRRSEQITVEFFQLSAIFTHKSER